MEGFRFGHLRLKGHVSNHHLLSSTISLPTYIEISVKAGSTGHFGFRPTTHLKLSFLHQLMKQRMFHFLITWQKCRDKTPLNTNIYIRSSNSGTECSIRWHSAIGGLSLWSSLPHWNATGWFHSGIEKALTQRAGGTSRSLKEDH